MLLMEVYFLPESTKTEKKSKMKKTKNIIMIIVRPAINGSHILWEALWGPMNPFIFVQRGQKRHLLEFFGEVDNFFFCLFFSRSGCFLGDIHHMFILRFGRFISKQLWIDRGKTT
jgi:hypothetical protein